MKKIFNLNNIVRKNVKELQPYSSARDECVSNGPEMVFLDANENPFENGVNRYPDPLQRNLKAILAKQKEVSTEAIFLGNGSDEVLDLIFRAFCEPKNDNIITLPPTYDMYDVLARINEIKNKKVFLTANFKPKIGEILNTVNEHSKIIFICSPNNPTGNSFSFKSIAYILAEFKGLVVIDEAYIDFSSEDSWVNKLASYPNLIVTQTLSKAYGMAGIRLGVCYASEEIIHILNKIKPPYNVNELTQKRALERILDIDCVKSEIKKIRQERDKLIKALSDIAYIQHIYPSDANFVLVKVDDANKRYQELLDMGIVVRNRTHQALCKNTLRFTIGTKKENLKLLKSLVSLGLL